jgi:hypothetical protein
VAEGSVSHDSTKLGAFAVGALGCLVFNEHSPDTSTVFAVPLELGVCLLVQTTGRKSDSDIVGILLALTSRDYSLDIAIQNH